MAWFRKINGLGVVLVALLFTLKLVCAIKTHGERCLSMDDCDTKLCSKRKVCECFPVQDYVIGSKVEQEYNNGLCQSKVMTMCTLPTTQRDKLPDLDCIANARCNFAPFGKGSLETFGVCKCNPGFIAMRNNEICIAESEVALKPEIAVTVTTEQTMLRNVSNSVKNDSRRDVLTAIPSFIKTTYQSFTAAENTAVTMQIGKNVTKAGPSNATLKVRIKAIAYMLSLAFNSFVGFITRT